MSADSNIFRRILSISRSAQADAHAPPAERVEAQTDFIRSCRGDRTTSEYAIYLGIDERYIQEAEAGTRELTPEQIAYIAHKGGLGAGANGIEEHDEPIEGRGAMADIMAVLAFPALEEPLVPERDARPEIESIDIPAGYERMTLDELVNIVPRLNLRWFKTEFDYPSIIKEAKWTTHWSTRVTSGFCHRSTLRESIIDAFSQIELARRQERSAEDGVVSATSSQ